MFRKLCVLMVLVIACFSCTNKHDGYIVEGDIANMRDGKVFLIERINKVYCVMAESTVQNGKFVFEGAVPEPCHVFLAEEDSTRFFQFFIDNSKIKLTGNRDMPEEIKVDGSKANVHFAEYLSEVRKIEDEENNLYAQYEDVRLTGDSLAEVEIEKQIVNVEGKYKNLVDSFVFNKPDCIISPYIVLSTLYYFSLAEMEAMYAVLTGDATQNSYFNDLGAAIEGMRKVSIGNKFVDFEMADPEGNMIKFSDKIGNGYLLLDFWASWCYYCRIENPNLVEMYNKYHDKGFDVFGVSLDNSKEDWLKAIEKDNLTWTHVSDLEKWNNSVAKLYVVRAIPSNFLISPEGIVVARNLTGKKLTSKLEEIYK